MNCCLETTAQVILKYLIVGIPNPGKPDWNIKKNVPTYRALNNMFLC